MRTQPDRIAVSLSRPIANELSIAAQRSGRSVGEEIDSRLERSFTIDRLIAQALFEGVRLHREAKRHAAANPIDNPS